MARGTRVLSSTLPYSNPSPLSSFLGYVDLLGTTYQSPTIATGFGAYIAQPLLRNAVDEREEPLTEDEALLLVQTCMKALFYRDARSLNKVCPSSLSRM